MDRKTIMIGVVGDSAAGKTTLTKGIVETFGPDQVTAICSDDYHRYNRKQRKEMGITALHPDCNYIDIMEQHLRLLREGHPILKPIYNHSTGDFDPPKYIKPTKYVIVEGLLAYHTRIMRLCFDVKVYLAPPEDLRKKWKVKRDTTKRGYAPEQVIAALEQRTHDSEAYILPQKNRADMVVRFYPPQNHEENGNDHLNAQLVLLPTIPHPDLTDLLAQGGVSNKPALRLELGRYQGKPVDFLEIDSDVTKDKAGELEHIIESHLPQAGHIDLDQLGIYQDGLQSRKSYPLALTQLLIAYQMVTAGEFDND